MQTIGHFSLRNQGGFVVKLQFVYWDDKGNKIHRDGTDSFPLGQTRTADPGDHGVPDGALVELYAFVVWGNDNEANQVFTYRKGSPVTAHYTISGTTLSNHLALTSVG
ncbi:MULTISPECIES: hypothetical protein [Comamonadaceae]|uniref:hypothetical protein n=1 Tax=Acidovorax sacchari TaxID=3230736 RepID=UPI0034A5D43C